MLARCFGSKFRGFSTDSGHHSAHYAGESVTEHAQPPIERGFIPFNIKKLRQSLRLLPMSSYLLTCNCGKTVPVDVGQAGGQVTCECGTRLDVPTLRQLRHLPRSTPAEERRQSSAWGLRQGIFAASLILAATLSAWGTWVWSKEPVIPEFNPADRMQAVEKQIKTPVGAWNGWVEFYRPMAEHGIPVFHISNAAAIEAAIAQARFFRWMLWALGAILAVIAACVAFWPKPMPMKKGR